MVTFIYLSFGEFCPHIASKVVKDCQQLKKGCTTLALTNPSNDSFRTRLFVHCFKDLLGVKYVFIANMQDHDYSPRNYQTVEVVCDTNMVFAKVIQCSGSYFAPRV